MFRHPSPTTTATHFNSQEKARTHLSGAAKPWCKPLCGFWVCVGEQWDPPQHSTPPAQCMETRSHLHGKSQPGLSLQLIYL